MTKNKFCQIALVAAMSIFAAGQPLAADTPSVTEQVVAVDDMAAGRKALQSKNWALAASSFKKIVAENPKNADAYNLLGYSSRWLGKYDEAFAAYDKALALDPKHKGALEYSGIAYLKVNQKGKAEAQLAKLKTICATCEETTDLAKAIAAYKP